MSAWVGCSSAFGKYGLQTTFVCRVKANCGLCGWVGGKENKEERREEGSKGRRGTRSEENEEEKKWDKEGKEEMRREGGKKRRREGLEEGSKGGKKWERVIPKPQILLHTITPYTHKNKHYSKRSGSTAVYNWHTSSSINLLTLALESHLCKAPKKDREHTHSRLIA